MIHVSSEFGGILILFQSRNTLKNKSEVVAAEHQPVMLILYCVPLSKNASINISLFL